MSVCLAVSDPEVRGAHRVVLRRPPMLGFASRVRPCTGSRWAETTVQSPHCAGGKASAGLHEQLAMQASQRFGLLS
jgi:hypothetical protein